MIKLTNEVLKQIEEIRNQDKTIHSWTPEEVRVLIKYYDEGLSYKSLAKIMSLITGRTISVPAINNQIRNLNASR